MSDERLREVERRWRESGSAEDEAGYLLERLRVGDFEEERLRLAAYCGHEGARIAVAHPPPVPNTLSTWLRGLESYGREWCVRAGLVLASLALPTWESSPVAEFNTPLEGPRRLVDAMENWLTAPTRENEDVTRSLAEGLCWPGQPPAIRAIVAAASTLITTSSYLVDVPGENVANAAKLTADATMLTEDTLHGIISGALAQHALSLS